MPLASAPTKLNDAISFERTSASNSSTDDARSMPKNIAASVVGRNPDHAKRSRSSPPVTGTGVMLRGRSTPRSATVSTVYSTAAAPRTAMVSVHELTG